MRRRTMMIAVPVAVLAVGAAAWLMRPDGASGSTGAPVAENTATVERTSLSSGLSLNGQLAFGSPRDVMGAGGVITSLPSAGDLIAVGQAIYSVDGRPAVLLRGNTPLWRDLVLGDSGEDVLALRAALAALGYDVGAVENAVYDTTLATAIGTLYQDRGWPVPSLSAKAAEKQKAANDELTAAQTELLAAKSALSGKAQGATAGTIAEADAAVAEAERVLTAAQQAAAAPPAEPGPDGTVPAPSEPAVSVADAQDRLTVARARRADLDARPDTTAETAAVTAAEGKVATATTTLAAARANSVGPQDVVMVPTDEIRIDAVPTTRGQAAEGKILSWTGSSLKAYSQLTATQAEQLATGTAVVVRLPDGTETPGKITAIAPAATDEQGMPIAPKAEIDLDDPAAVAGAGLVSVRIIVPAEQVDDALVVPVTAVVALAEGGFAVEIARGDGTTQLVPVELGIVADTRVQIIGDGLAAGDEVVVP